MCFLKRKKKKNPLVSTIKIVYLKINRQCFKPKIQKFAEELFITKPLLLFLADRGPPIAPTGVNFYVVDSFRDAFTAAEKHQRGPFIAMVYCKTRH